MNGTLAAVLHNCNVIIAVFERLNFILTVKLKGPGIRVVYIRLHIMPTQCRAVNVKRPCLDVYGVVVY